MADLLLHPDFPHCRPRTAAPQTLNLTMFSDVARRSGLPPGAVVVEPADVALA